MNDVTRLFVEAYVGLRLRLAVIQRLLGIQDWSALQTVLAAGFVANALRRLAAPILKAARPSFPSAGITLPAAALPSAIIHRVTGVKPRDAHLVGAAAAVSYVLPTLRLIASSTRAVSHAVVAYVRRYWRL